MANQSKTPQNSLSVSELVKLAQQAHDEFSPGIAAKYYEAAIKQQPNNALLHHKLGLMHVEHGEPEQAHNSFLKSIELSPNENESNYLYVGQQCFGNAAKSAFEKGVVLMRDKLKTLKNEKLKKEIKSQISSVYVSIAELFLTDLCQTNDAQIECEKYLSLSLEFDANNIETYATFGQFRHCQERTDDAIKYFAISLKKLFENDNDESMDIFGVNGLCIDSFLKIAKLGIELEQFEQSLLVLKKLVFVNDRIGESWALGSFCFYKLGNNKEAAIWLNNAESILLCGDGSTLNFELNDTLQAIKSEMNMNTLPDLNKLNLDENDDEKEIDAFLEEDECDDYDDVDLIQDKMMKHKLDHNEDCDLNDNNVIDIVM